MNTVLPVINAPNVASALVKFWRYRILAFYSFVCSNGGVLKKANNDSHQVRFNN
jgi:hypothetical protein